MRNEGLPKYEARVRKHLVDYIRCNYPESMIDKEKPFSIRSANQEDGLLEVNRGRFKKHVSDYPWQDYGNLANAQAMTLDWFLPYIESLGTLHEALAYDVLFTKMSFKRCVNDYVRIDVVLEDEEGAKVLVKTGYTEPRFIGYYDESVSQEGYKRLYYRINHLMDKADVTLANYCKYAPLYRYLYNAFMMHDAWSGAFIMLIPHENTKLRHMAQTFMEKLKQYGFKHLDRVKVLYLENLPMPSAFKNKYINVKDACVRLTVDVKEGEDLEVSSHQGMETMIDLLASRDSLNVRLLDDGVNPKGLFTGALAALEARYDLYGKEDTLDKDYGVYKKVNIDLTLSE